MIENLDLLAVCEEVKSRLPKSPAYVYVETFGCQQNVADSEKMRGIAEAMGYRSTNSPEEADLILVNTCAIREHAEQKVLSLVGRFKRLWEEKPHLLIGITGCMTAQPHRVEQIKFHYHYINFTLAPGALHDLPKAVLHALKKDPREHRPPRSFHLEQHTDSVVEGIPTSRTEKHKAWVSIMYGCNNFCSYCIVPYVRGRERSRASSEIVSEVQALVADGVKEITLLGQNVNSYQGDCDFATLLEKLAQIEGDFLLHFMTSHPKDVPDRLIEVMAKYPHRIAPHFHLPLQSGADEILKAMNRRYTYGRYKTIVEKLRSVMPNIAITSDIIVGFPGETEEHFEATLSALREIRYDMLYAFIYSPRKGTVAAARDDQISPEVKKERMGRLLQLQDEIASEKAAAFLGQTVRVLIDGPSKSKSDVYSGRTAENRLVHIPSAVDITGEYVNAKIIRADAYALHGELVN